MKIAFRIECPHCRWGFPWNDTYVNQGWLKVACNHCESEFWTKITLNEVKVEIKKEPPEEPVRTLI